MRRLSGMKPMRPNRLGTRASSRQKRAGARNLLKAQFSRIGIKEPHRGKL